MGARQYYVYILANRIGGTLYIGVTNDLIRRIGEHKLKIAENFTKRHDVTRLVYFEAFDQVLQAIQREKTIEEMAASVENYVDRERKSGLDRSLSGDCRGRRIGLWNTGSPGQAGR